MSGSSLLARRVSRALAVTAAAALALALPGLASASTPPAGVHVLGGGFDTPKAIASDGGHVWVANEYNDTVSELSATTGKYVRTLLGPAYDFADPDAIAVAGPDVWVANAGGNSLTEINATTGAAVRVISAASYGFAAPSKIASNGKDLWVVDNPTTPLGYPTDGVGLTEVNASSGALVRTIEDVGGASAIAANSSDVLVAYPNDEVNNQNVGTVIEFSATTGQKLWEKDSYLYHFNDLTGVALVGSHAWVAGTSLTEINVPSGDLVRVESTVKQPGALTAYGSDLWMTSSGHAVTEVNASNGHVVRRIASSRLFPATTALAAGPTHVWAANSATATLGPSVTELTTATGHLVQIIGGSGYDFSSLRGVAISGSHVWVLNNAGHGTITELNATTGAVVHVLHGTTSHAYYAGTSTEPIVSDGPDVWVSSSLASGAPTVTEIKASTGAVVRVISGSKYLLGRTLTTNGTDVWVANTSRGSVTEFSAATGKLVRVMSASAYGFDGPAGIAVSGPDVWVANQRGRSITELSASTGKVVRIITAFQYDLTDPTLVRAAGGHIWVAGGTPAPQNSTQPGIDEINPSTGALVRVLPYQGQFAADATHLWVPTGGNSISELSETTGAVVRVVSGAAYDFQEPAYLASNGADVWVLDPSIDMVTGFPTA